MHLRCLCERIAYMPHFLFFVLRWLSRPTKIYSIRSVCVRLFIVSSNLMAEPLCPSSLPPLFDRLRRKYIEGIAYGVYVFACVVDSWGFLQENSGVLSCRHTSFTRRSVFRLNSNDLIYKSKSINATQHTTHRSRARSMSIAIVVETRYD